MIWPPMLMQVEIKKTGEDGFHIWLPLFLLLPIGLVILIILSPLILIATIVLWPSGWGKWAWLALWGAIVTYWSMRGLKVDIQNQRETIYVSVI